jgi:hypothetical protein
MGQQHRKKLKRMRRIRRDKRVKERDRAASPKAA